jgi:organic hydroperoxide reductase OsmC/OhrA
MTSIASTEFETRLQWQGNQRGRLCTEQADAVSLGGMVEGRTPADLWAPEELLVAAVEGRTLLAFLEQARARGIEVLFYQSSALGRRVELPGSRAHFTDLIVRPHVAVRSDEAAEQVLRIFEALPPSLFPSSILKLEPRIEPIVEVWENQDLNEGPPLSPSHPAWRTASVPPYGS